MTAYYNEFDPKAAAWLRELIKENLIAKGDVDERSIIDVQPSDLRGYDQCHFFAGIGGWSYALRLAGVRDSEPLWTASLPCQPFSTAGKGLGKDDERHLLPHFIKLVRQSKPKRIFGEQVEGAVRHGWLDDLQAAMEAEGYAVGAAVLGAHSVGSYHQRQRLYWVADSGRLGESNKRVIRHDVFESRVGKPDSYGYKTWCKASEATRFRNTSNAAGWTDVSWAECRDGKFRPVKPGIQPLVNRISKGVVSSRDPDCSPVARVMRLKGYGNAIVPQVAATFIESFYEVLDNEF